MADSRYAGEAGLQAVFGQIKAAMAEKQDKINDMGLSHNDYSNEEKQKNAQNTSDIVALNNDIDDIIEKMDGDATTYPYADVITIPDAVPANVADCNVKIEPVQDLHGYDHPWVGGAGKNKLNSNYYAGSSFIQSNVTIAKNTDGSLDVTINGSCSGTVNYMFLNTDAGSGLKAGSYKAILKAEGTYTGNVILTIGGGSSGVTYTTATLNTATEAFTIENDDDTLHYCLLQFPAGATVTGTLKIYPMICSANEDMTTWAPYENICPISGHTEASVQRDGRNLFDISSAQQGYDIKNDGSIVSASDSHYVSDYIMVKAGATYHQNSTGDWANIGNAFYDGSKNFIGFISGHDILANSNNFTIPNRALYCRITAFEGVQLEYGSTSTPYVPYAGKTYTIALGDTIYGGTVRIDSNGNTVMDVGSGVLVIDENTQNMTLHNTGDSTAVFKIATGQACVNDARQKSNISTHDTNGWNSQIAKNCFVMGQEGDLYIQVPLTVASTLSDFTTWLASNNVQIFYPLKDADITTIQLTPQQIQLLKGTNTLTASTGQISVTVNGVSGAIGSVQEQVNELAKKLPDAPTTDGVYTLTVTVADGVPTYSWESAE